MKTCPRCDGPATEDALRQFGGVCEKCLLDFAAERDAPSFPDLEIKRTLGEGGMGVVYEAVQKTLGRTVALKVLSPELAADPAFVERFTREAQALASLSHPNIVGIHDFGVHDGVPFLVMEHVQGASLRKALAAGKLTPAKALEVIPQICDALAYAHSKGVVHRDIKPENVLLTPDGRVKIADFGLAKLAEADQTRITRTNAVMGTPHYMAPEQVENPNTVDHRADIYSLGVVFYEMLTGELPLGRFKAPSEKSGGDARLDPVVLKSLEKEPADRWQSAGEMKDRVTRLDAPPARAAARPKPYVAEPQNLWPWLSIGFGFMLLVAIGLGLALGGFLGWESSPPWFSAGWIVLLLGSLLSAIVGIAAAPTVNGRARGRLLSLWILGIYVGLAAVVFPASSGKSFSEHPAEAPPLQRASAFVYSPGGTTTVTDDVPLHVIWPDLGSFGHTVTQQGKAAFEAVGVVPTRPELVRARHLSIQDRKAELLAMEFQTPEAKDAKDWEGPKGEWSHRIEFPRMTIWVRSDDSRVGVSLRMRLLGALERGIRPVGSAADRAPSNPRIWMIAKPDLDIERVWPLKEELPEELRDFELAEGEEALARSGFPPKMMADLALARAQFHFGDRLILVGIRFKSEFARGKWTQTLLNEKHSYGQLINTQSLDTILCGHDQAAPASAAGSPILQKLIERDPPRNK